MTKPARRSRRPARYASISPQDHQLHNSPEPNPNPPPSQRLASMSSTSTTSPRASTLTTTQPIYRSQQPWSLQCREQYCRRNGNSRPDTSVPVREQWPPTIFAQGDKDDRLGSGIEYVERAVGELEAARAKKAQVKSVVGESHVFNLPPFVG